MKAIKLLSLFCVSMTTVAFGQVKTFIFHKSTPSQQIEIKANEVVQVLFYHDLYRFEFKVNDLTARIYDTELEPAGYVHLPVIAGPATMIVTGSPVTETTRGILTIKTTVQSDTLTPTAAVVIPSDAKGPANVILESSTNLVSWTAALPGTYGKSAQTRFFRVRAELLE
ncbi:MAG: hypothetical protein HYY24_15410 [Verrucomicrobia bacterium]|nr:hypothetical protein [Verrucomicrobiota bacterium]